MGLMNILLGLVRRGSLLTDQGMKMTEMNSEMNRKVYWKSLVIFYLFFEPPLIKIEIRLESQDLPKGQKGFT